MLIHRNITPNLLEALSDTPVVMVTGARQSGKSTLVQSNKVEGRQYLTFDDVGVLAAAKADPIGFLAGGLEVIPFANNLHAVPLQALWQPIGR